MVVPLTRNATQADGGGGLSHLHVGRNNRIQSLPKTESFQLNSCVGSYAYRFVVGGIDEVKLLATRENQNPCIYLITLSPQTLSAPSRRHILDGPVMHVLVTQHTADCCRSSPAFQCRSPWLRRRDCTASLFSTPTLRPLRSGSLLVRPRSHCTAHRALPPAAKGKHT